MKEEHHLRMEELKAKESAFEAEKEAYVKIIQEECEEKIKTMQRRFDRQVCFVFYI